ncbi:MAG: hypothetical protein M3300_00350 [Actinomycetota bacterium]|nr:hypothetical protein [Actinomycetota bacterium]
MSPDIHTACWRRKTAYAYPAQLVAEQGARARPVAAAIGDPDAAPAFPPLLSQIRIKRTMPTELI